MNTDSATAEIERAVTTLGLPPEAMRRLPLAESESVYLAALRHFVSSGDRVWWWEDFKSPAVSLELETGDGWRHLENLVPDPDELLWLIAEDEQFPHYPVFETTTSVASKVLGQCYAFEYYLIPKNLGWIVCENHHNVLLGVGAEVEERLRRHVV